MGVKKTEQEVASPLPAEKLYKGLFLEIDEILPKAYPEGIKSVEVVEGDGGVGTIKHISLAGGSYSSVKQRVDAIDKAALTYSNTIIGGDVLLDPKDSIVNHFTVVPTNGGSILKNTTIFNTHVEAVVPDEYVKEVEENSFLHFKAIEAYLLVH